MSLATTLLNNIKYEDLKRRKDRSRNKNNAKMPPNNKNKRFIRPRMNSALPAAYISHVRSRFTYNYRGKSSCVVSGCDLIYSIPTDLAASTDTLFTIIPANPAYWKGTRIAMIAPAYQNYRPLNFKVSYIPQVSVTQPGTVFMGTLWNAAAPTQNIQQSLITSNGGLLTQCYVPADTSVKLGSNLQQRLFQLSGSLNLDTNPFTFLAGVRGSTVVPGYFYVTYRYEFRNPLGESWTYNNTGLTTLAQLPIQTAESNGTLILLSQNGSLGPGTQLDRESDGIKYHGSPVNLDPQTQVIYLNNHQTSETSNDININNVAIETTIHPISTFQGSIKASSTVSVPSKQQILSIVEEDDYYLIKVFRNTSSSAQDLAGIGLYLISEPGQVKLYSDSMLVTTMSDDPTDAIPTELQLSTHFFNFAN